MSQFHFSQPQLPTANELIAFPSIKLHIV